MKYFFVNLIRDLVFENKSISNHRIGITWDGNQESRFGQQVLSYTYKWGIGYKIRNHMNKTNLFTRINTRPIQTNSSHEAYSGVHSIIDI